MRHLKYLWVGLIIALLRIPVAQGEQDTLAVRDLKGITPSEWRETWEGYSQAVEVHTDIYLPDVGQVPILKVKQDSQVREPLKSELEAKYKKANKKDSKHYYSFLSGEYETRLEHAVPLLWGKTKKDDRETSAKAQDWVDLTDYDPDQAYAENNPMTVREAEETALLGLKEIYPDISFQPDEVMLFGKTYWVKNKKAIYNQGSYFIRMRQCFQGIPCMACINDTYTDQSHTNLRDSWNTVESGHAVVYVYGQGSWWTRCMLYHETEMIKEDTNLVPLDEIKKQVQGLVRTGHIRHIYSISLGYVLFDTREEGEYLLAPCWVFWCRYHPEGGAAEETYGINSERVMFYGNNAYYRAIIFDAQTGRMFDTEDSSRERFLYPGYVE